MLEKKSLSKKDRINFILLISLCWLVYTASLIGKYGYDSTNVAIKEAFNVDKISIGIVSSCFFFAYGCGQIINGLLVKKFKLKYIISGALFISAILNLSMGLVENFSLYKYIWLLNGIVTSTMWCSVMRTLSETLKKEYLAKAVVVMSTTTAVGTSLTYGMSALFVKFLSYRYTFYVAAILLPIIAIVWYSFFDKLTANKEVENNENKDNKTIEKKKISIPLFILIGTLGLISISTNLIRQGLTTWVPTILKETYSLSDSLSIILTLALPIISIVGAFVAVWLNKKIKDYVLLCGFFFAVSIVFQLLVIFLISKVSYIFTLSWFSIICMAMTSNNNITTSLTPLLLRDKVNSGMLAGLLNGFCYVGSTISSFGLGGIADKYGWDMVFNVLLVVSFASLILVAIYMFLAKKKKLSVSD